MPNVSVEATTGKGKTSFLLTAPLPIVLSSFDLGAKDSIYGSLYPSRYEGLKIHFQPYDDKVSAEDLVKQAPWAENDITVIEVPEPIQMSGIRVTGATERWEYFMRLYVAAAMHDKVRTLGIDTGGLMRRMRMASELQTKQEAKPDNLRERLTQIEYGPINDASKNIFTFTASLGKNMIVTHHLDDRYGDKLMQDGTIKHDAVLAENDVIRGYKDTNDFMDFAVRLDWNNKGELEARFTKCRPNRELQDQTRDTPISDPTWDRVLSRVEMSIGKRIEYEKRGKLIG